MSEFFNALSDDHIAFIHAQPMFFTATACAEGRINLSPKGGDGLHRVINHNLFCYLDLTGSGNETSAHLTHDGRITVMFNSFTRNAMIMRLYGHGRTATSGSPEFEKYISLFPDNVGTRQLMLVDIDQMQTSCGYAVPHMEISSHRDALDRWAESKGREGVLDYQQEINLISIDGLEIGLAKQTP
ncbi:MAG TPA: pyridoxamine 5'-phosphate oxidase family protein [Sneathiellales bacterium]|nr:pyridoxamine 5'-phosphate oxidase family protein [Sneathiellales bacterium]